MQLGLESVDEFHSPMNQIHSEMPYNCKSLYVPQLSRERLSRACKMVPLGQLDLEENGGGGREPEKKGPAPAHPSARILKELSLSRPAETNTQKLRWLTCSLFLLVVCIS